MRITSHLSIVASILFVAAQAASAQMDVARPPIGQAGPDAPQYHFQIACLNCENGNQGIAARQIRIGLDQMKQEARRATTNGKLALNGSIRELERLADSIERGTVASIEDLQAASYDIEYGISWVGEGVETKSRDVLTGTRDLGNALIGGAKLDVNRIDAQARSLGSELKRFGDQIVRPVNR